MQKKAVRIVYWGTYDLGKPRNRIMMRGLAENSVELLECHVPVWGGIEDKSQVRGLLPKLRIVIRLLLAYPRLVYRYLRLPRHDFVVVGYLGHLDVLVLWPFAKLRSVPLVWDAFLSLYETVVEDRAFVRTAHPLAWLLLGWERLACRAAQLIVLDTEAHADYFRERYRRVADKVGAVFVGVEPERFPAGALPPVGKELLVLFYGQMIPLHGIETVVLAARQTQDAPVRWVIIGRGQEGPRVDQMLDEQPLENVTRIPWVPYEELSSWLQRADICLGIFGDTEKAARVIPNKTFQALGAGRPVITRDSPAMRELTGGHLPGVFLVPPANPDELARTVRQLAAAKASGEQVASDVGNSIFPKAIGMAFLQLIQRHFGRTGPRRGVCEPTQPLPCPAAPSPSTTDERSSAPFDSARMMPVVNMLRE